MEEDRDGDIFSSTWFRALVAGAVLSGGAGGLASLSVDDADRYRGADAKRDFDIRDSRILTNATRITTIEASLSSHYQHSATYTQIIVEMQKDMERLEARIKDIERDRRRD